LRFLEIALGSLRETENFLLLARDLGFLKSDRFITVSKLSDETARTLSGLISAVRRPS